MITTSTICLLLSVASLFIHPTQPFALFLNLSQRYSIRSLGSSELLDGSVTSTDSCNNEPSPFQCTNDIIRLSECTHLLSGDNLTPHNRPSSTVEATQLTHYTKLTKLTDDTVATNLMQQGNLTLLCMGHGKEFCDTEQILYAPKNAVRHAFVTYDGIPNNPHSKTNLTHPPKKILVNFLGGVDLLVNEIIFAVELVMENLKLELNEHQVMFHAVYQESFQTKEVSVTVFQGFENEVRSEISDENGTMRESKGENELWFHEGVFWTLKGDDLSL